MSFFSRQQDELTPLNEVSFATFTPGAVANGATVGVSQAFTLSGGNPATFTQGDRLDIYPSAGVALNGLHISAFPTTTNGTAQVVFINTTGASITPVSGKYTLVVSRILNTLVS